MNVHWVPAKRGHYKRTSVEKLALPSSQLSCDQQRLRTKRRATVKTNRLPALGLKLARWWRRKVQMTLDALCELAVARQLLLVECTIATMVPREGIGDEGQKGKRIAGGEKHFDMLRNLWTRSWCWHSRNQIDTAHSTYIMPGTNQ